MKTKQKNSLIPPLGVRGLMLYALLLAFASCSSCKKDVDPTSQLPPATQTGANTFGAVINGQAWVPNGVSTIPVTRPINGGYVGQSISATKYSVQIRTYASDRSGMQLYVKSVIKPGRYPLSFDTGTDPFYPQTQNFGLYYINGITTDDPDYSYITTSQVTGFVDFVVADTASKRLAGTFEFEGIDFPSGKKTKITGGRFDIDQKTLNK